MADTDEIEDVEAPRDVERPRGRTSWPTIVLIVLNALALPGFAVLLVLDYNRRTDWARAVFLRDLATVGLPVDEQDLGTNPDAALQGKYALDPPLVKDAYKARGGSLTDKFMAVNETFK